MARTALLVTSALAVAAIGLQVPAAHGKHSWGNYHWERGSDRANFDLRHNLHPDWDDVPANDSTFLVQAQGDWTTTEEIVITSIIDDNGPEAYDPATCEITDDKYNSESIPDPIIEVCSNSYGANGWLGLAMIWYIDNGHIVKAVAKLNDYYFNTSTYDRYVWRDLVMCQEVGHAFGLGHQDESFMNPDKKSGGLETCMDYTNRPEGNGQPNAHDYDQLKLIYNHDDTGGNPDTVVDSGPGNGKGGGPKKAGVPGKLVSVSGFQFATYVRNDPSEWGTAVAFTDKGQPHVFVKNLDNGVKVVTHVTWTEDARAGVHFPHQH